MFEMTSDLKIRKSKLMEVLLTSLPYELNLKIFKMILTKSIDLAQFGFSEGRSKRYQTRIFNIRKDIL